MPALSLGNLQLDKILGGGITEDKCTILVGDPGSGKSTLALQFVTNPKICNVPSAYLCIDKRPEQIMARAVNLNKTVHHQIQNGTLKFVEIALQDWTPDQSINDLLLILQLQVDAFFRNFSPQRLIIDSLLPHALCGCSKENRQYFIREFLQIINSYSITTLGILYDIETHYNLWLDTSIISDQLVFNRKSDLDYATYWLEISKNNDRNMSGKYRFTFDSKKGIQLKHRLC
jgi:KaiC/GvpD/RAD55 family RecA-like ATPase